MLHEASESFFVPEFELSWSRSQLFIVVTIKPDL